MNEHSSRVGKRIIEDHNYANTGLCNAESCESVESQSDFHQKIKLGSNVSREGWRDGRRIVELVLLLENLKYCQSCKLGLVPLAYYNIVGELQKGSAKIMTATM